MRLLVPVVAAGLLVDAARVHGPATLGRALLVAALVRNRSARHWLPAALGAIAVALLLGLNASNPEATIARVNIDRAHGGVPLDLAYLAGLSADAATVLAGDPHTRALVAGRFERPGALLGWNLALARVKVPGTG